MPARLKKVEENDVPSFLWRSVPDEAALAKLPEAERFGSETDARQVFDRLAGTWTYWGWKGKYFASEADALAFRDELAYMLATQRVAPNSPQWFNTGLHWAYGIDGPGQGHYYVDPFTGKLTKSKSAYEHPQPHACFIQGVQDDLVNEGGIMDLWVREARLFKYGSGTGSNFSMLRGEGERLSGGGRSSGLMSFLKIGDRAAGAIKSGGTTRRAAKMVIVDADHPDIEAFIDWKVKEEEKVASLVTGSKIVKKHLAAIMKACVNCEGHDDDCFDPAINTALKRAIKDAKKNAVPENYVKRVIQFARQGYTAIDFQTYDTDWDSDAYLTVSGQNSNNSISLKDDFLRAVEKDESWNLIKRIDGKVHKTLKARDLWEKIGYAAWASADPGLHFNTTMNDWHTCVSAGAIRASNPCSEYMFLDDTACNLASINLLPYRNADGTIDVAAYEHTVRLWTIVLEISVMMAQFPSKEIARLSYEYRTLGLGYANIGGLLMTGGIPYDSAEGRAICAAVTAIMTGIAYATSAEMAAELGAFPDYDRNAGHMLRVMRNHRRAAHGEKDGYEKLAVNPVPLVASDLRQPALAVHARAAWDRAIELGEAHGYRNAQATVIAPTGTIGLIMDCDTTGIEPDFALVKFKKLAGGGYFKIVNASVERALERLGYSKAQITEIVAYVVGTNTFVGAPKVNREFLKQKGLTADEIEKIEDSLPGAFSIEQAFSVFSLGQGLIKRLGFEEAAQKPGWSLLEAWGLDRADIEALSDQLLGRMTVEGAPHLRDEHLPVFDCANRCGKIGQRYLAPMSHIKMMAAVQPFLSGAISKTVNLPNDATVDEVAEIYRQGWKLGLKAVALYRDGCKASQPLSTTSKEEKVEAKVEAKTETKVEAKVEARAVTPVVAPPPVATGSEAAAEFGPLFAKAPVLSPTRQSVRFRLPRKRRGFTQEARIAGHKVFLRTGEYEDGQLGEIFIDMHKEGAAFRSLMNSFAIAVSMGLQHGVSLAEYVDQFTFTRFEPQGSVEGHPNVKFATSIIDYVFRVLAVEYLKRYDLAHVPPSEAEAEVATPPVYSPTLAIDRPAAVPSTSTTHEIGMVAGSALDQQLGKMMGDAPFCDNCGHITVRNGACYRCLNCGSSMGCS
ncbi:MAG: vitamin B12-dependent ribonucleotide reductase [Myxococcales bacterium]|nr:vitamin B12-dependent ribonucleotide reductase [Myxococcales bacterium]